MHESRRLPQVVEDQTTVREVASSKLGGTSNTIQYILNWPLPTWASGPVKHNHDRTEQQQLLSIPTGLRQASWLQYLQVQLTSGQNESWTRELRVSLGRTASWVTEEKKTRHWSLDKDYQAKSQSLAHYLESLGHRFPGGLPS